MKECKHNWTETKSNGAYPYVPNTKQYNFRCVRCDKVVSSLIGVSDVDTKKPA